MVFLSQSSILNYRNVFFFSKMEIGSSLNSTIRFWRVKNSAFVLATRTQKFNRKQIQYGNFNITIQLKIINDDHLLQSQLFTIQYFYLLLVIRYLYETLDQDVPEMILLRKGKLKVGLYILKIMVFQYFPYFFNVYGRYYKSSVLEIFCKKGLFETFCKIQRKTSKPESLLFTVAVAACNFIKKETLCYELCELSKY